MTVTVDPSCLYAETHEWVRIEGDFAYAGITDYAQTKLSDIVFVEMPEVGDTFAAGDVYAVVESVKAASDCYLPLSGEIVEINERLEEAPETVNKSPYGDGWFVKIALENPEEAEALMDSEAYEEFAAEFEAKGGH